MPLRPKLAIHNFSYDELAAQIGFDPDALDDAIEGQAGLFLRTAEAEVLALSRRDKAKSDMELAYVSASAEARKNLEKPTVDAVKETAMQDQDYLEAEQVYLRAKEEADRSSALRSAFDQRGKMLREMVQLFLAGYYQASGVGQQQSREVNEEAGRKARALLSAARKERMK